jgi:hypothetical protein
MIIMAAQVSFFIDAGGVNGICSSGLNNSVILHGEYGIRADLPEAVDYIQQ